MYCMSLSSPCLHISSLFFAFLFWPGINSDRETHAGVILWRKVEGATETWTWKTNHLQPVWDAEKLCIEVINGKLFSACAFTTKRLHHEIFKKYRYLLLDWRGCHTGKREEKEMFEFLGNIRFPVKIYMRRFIQLSKTYHLVSANSLQKKPIAKGTVHCKLKKKKKRGKKDFSSHL